MKKTISVLLAIFLSLSLCSFTLAEDSTSEDSATTEQLSPAESEPTLEDPSAEETAGDEELWGEIVDEDDYLANSPENVLLAAMEVYSWFIVHPLDVDMDSPSADGKKYKVLDERFNTYEALSTFVHFYFSDEIAQDLLSKGIYTEENGALYTSTEGREIDTRIETTDIQIVDQDENRITYKVTVQYSEPDEYGTETENHTYVRDMVNGEWKFTTFPFFW